MDKNLRIAAGNTLTIFGTPSEPTVFSMPKDGMISIEKGGRLELIHATITNNCGQTWRGIEVKGDVTAPQTAANQGVVILDNARIEHAKNALAVNINSQGGGGGMIFATETVFHNNKRTAEFFPHPNNNSSYFTNCTFSIENDFRFDNLIGHVTMFDMAGITFSGCTFENKNSSLAQTSMGIFALDAHFIVEEDCLFSGFHEAIRVERNARTFSVTKSSFFNNFRGIAAEGVNNISIKDIMAYNNTSGVYLDNADAIIECSDFYNNSNYGVFSGVVSLGLQTAPPTTAIDCWWGATSGPQHSSNSAGSGDRVSDNVVFSPWAMELTTSCSILPVELIDFKGRLLEDKSVVLDWTVGHEINIDHYIIERSADGELWKNIQNVKSKSSTAATQQYKTIDDALPFQTLKDVVFYRLKMMNQQGQFDSYSNVIAIDLPEIYEIALWYDQGSEQLTLVTDEAAIETGFDIFIYSMDGRLMRQYSAEHFGVFQQRLDIPIQSLGQGMYVAHFKTKNQMVVKRFVVW